ncbi:MAG: PAS domain-containing protein [Acidobacteria bacterium]|nr:PAS domain-containing protein [Acidobacteriota bacterium]
MQFRPLFFDGRCSLRGRLILAGLVLESVLISNAILLILENRHIPGILLFLVALAGTVIGVHTDRRLRANVAKLIEATSQILQGVAEGRMQIDTGDQLEVLGNHFNAMAQAIRRREDENLRMQAQLNEQAVQLELQVMARTRELAEERGKLNAIVTAIPTGLVLLDCNQTVLWANRVVEEWCGPAASMIGKRCHQMLWRASHACQDCPTKRALRTGQVEASEKLTLNEKGDKKHFQIVSSPLKNPDGTVSGVVELVQDITESRQLQAQLAQAGKMAAIGQLAAGVAHEINNPIGIILGKTELVLSNYTSVLPHKVVSDLQMIGRHSHRIAAITCSLLQMSRRGVDDWTEVNLNELVQETLPLVEHPFLSSKSRLKLALRSSLPSIRGNPGELQEVLLNLLDNALHAMPERGGEVAVATDYLSPLENGGGNGSVVLVVRDTGTGIPETIRDRIFDPFFTTKAVGKGTGLGLAILHGIVKSHAGTITVESETGKGTTFQITFPCTNGEHRLRNRPLAGREERRPVLQGDRNYRERKDRYLLTTV